MNLQYIYNNIAHHFDNTRSYIWKGVKDFIIKIPKNSLVLDAGCGNGKNMFRPDLEFIGFDFSIELIKISKTNGKNVLVSDIQNIPFRNNLFDYTISVAVIHHLNTDYKMIKAINELIRVTKHNGKLFIQVWSKKNNLGKQFHNINGNHYLVEWNNSIKTEKYYRYYYLFTLSDCLRIFKNINYTKLISIVYEKNNWIIILQKY